MYCAYCGVALKDTEKECPLCGTPALHPALPPQNGEPLYPQKKAPSFVHSLFPAVLLTAIILMTAVTVFLCDTQLTGGVSWSGYVLGALCVLYVSFVLPAWFQNPNPVIFLPPALLTLGAYLWYISFVTEGVWFWRFVLPTYGGCCLVLIAVVTLMRYVKKGALYIFGGALIALGLFCMPVELLANITFGIDRLFWWSFYPLNALCFSGGLLIFIAIYRPAREYMKRKFFF